MQKSGFYKAVVTVAFMTAASSGESAPLMRDTLIKKLQLNPAVKGAIASVANKEEKCQKPVIAMYTPDGAFKVSIACEVAGNEDDGGGIADTILIFGENISAPSEAAEILINKIEFQHAD